MDTQLVGLASDFGCHLSLRFFTPPEGCSRIPLVRFEEDLLFYPTVALTLYLQKRRYTGDCSMMSSKGRVKFMTHLSSASVTRKVFCGFWSLRMLMKIADNAVHAFTSSNSFFPAFLYL